MSRRRTPDPKQGQVWVGRGVSPLLRLVVHVQGETVSYVERVGARGRFSSQVKTCTVADLGRSGFRPRAGKP